MHSISIKNRNTASQHLERDGVEWDRIVVTVDLCGCQLHFTVGEIKPIFDTGFCLSMRKDRKRYAISIANCSCQIMGALNYHRENLKILFICLCVFVEKTYKKIIYLYSKIIYTHRVFKQTKWQMIMVVILYLLLWQQIIIISNVLCCGGKHNILWNFPLCCAVFFFRCI